MIEDFDKTKKVDFQSSESLVHVDSVPLAIVLEINLHDDENKIDSEDSDHI